MSAPEPELPLAYSATLISLFAGAVTALWLFFRKTTARLDKALQSRIEFQEKQLEDARQDQIKQHQQYISDLKESNKLVAEAIRESDKHVVAATATTAANTESLRSLDADIRELQKEIMALKHELYRGGQ